MNKCLKTAGILRCLREIREKEQIGNDCQYMALIAHSMCEKD